ncbi:hypothetical protein DL766_006661 [Monosporascus sp. MC13-8B]|uniref:Uncharacterized protein n=1 Tax=Monosporascus cannonballus TaxID=155416 RepID=A0ABY0H6P2_9PEZI|nr:hypothetical protein DL763_011239 [Monosporascus cannonballus]RYO85476.1 hypothetical protein DL762_005166 [Monosporascus cannonballus]RYP26636.1 hypothetical protein DL766_006661 [Monosporascus sp. MC13-8B]
MGKNSRLKPKAFPITDFNYGSPTTVSETERKKRAGAMKGRWRKATIPPMEAMFTGEATKRKKLHDHDKHTIAGAITSDTYMKNLILAHPPSQEVDLTDVLAAATKIKPQQQPANSVLWMETMGTLERVISEGHQRGWKDDSLLPINHLPSLTSFEMLRIYGDQTMGFGTWPQTVSERMDMAGVGWIRVPPEKRIIPSYWKEYCDRRKIKYARVASIAGRQNAVSGQSAQPLSQKPELRLLNKGAKPTSASTDEQSWKQGLINERNTLDDQLAAPSPWDDARNKFRGFSGKEAQDGILDKVKDNLVTLVKAVDQHIHHDAGQLQHLRRAASVDALSG